MIEFSELWLPIVVATVAVFFLSFVMWMVLPHHKGDYARLPDEDRVMEVLRESGVREPGQYMVPHCAGPEQWKDEAWVQRYSEGPKGILVLKAKGRGDTGAAMLVSTIYNLVVIAAVAWLATMVLPRVVVDDGLLFRFFGLATFLGFSGALGWGPIWFGKSWSSTLKEVVDGLIYGATTGLVFMWLWPGVA